MSPTNVKDHRKYFGTFGHIICQLIALYNVLPLFAYTHHILGSRLLLILSTQNNNSVKTIFTHDMRKNTVLGVGLVSNTALGFILCCIYHSNPPLILYFPYITCNGALTYLLNIHFM